MNALMGIPQTLDDTVMQLVIDGIPVNLTDSKLQGLIICNIDSYGGGAKLWNYDEDNRQDMPKHSTTDGRIEVGVDTKVIVTIFKPLTVFI
jgi:hypothetical protein